VRKCVYVILLGQLDTQEPILKPIGEL